MVCGLAMGLVCCVGDLALGIQCESPAAFIGAGLLTVFVDVNLMFALAYAFRHIGKAIAVILLIVQIPGLGHVPHRDDAGLLPGHSSASALHLFHRHHTRGHRLLRDGLPARHVAAGTFVRAPGFAIGLGIGRCDFNLNLMFDEKLGQPTCFWPSRSRPALSRRADAARYRTRTLVRALLNIDAFRQALIARASVSTALTGAAAHRLGGACRAAACHLRHYGAGACRRGCARHDALMAMVVGVIVVDTYLIVISYLDTNLAHQLALQRT